MRTQFICLALAIVLVCPLASAQWVQKSFRTTVEYTYADFGWDNGALYQYGHDSIYRSTDYGDSWKSLTSWSRSLGNYVWITGVDSLLVMWVAEGVDRRGYDNHFHAIRSTDGGQTWHDTTTWTGRQFPGQAVAANGRIFFAQQADSPNSIVHYTARGMLGWDSAKGEGLAAGFRPGKFLAKDSLLFLVDGDLGIYKSSDLGNSWILVFRGDEGGCGFVVDDSLLFAWNSDTLAASSDNGQTWSILGPPPAYFCCGIFSNHGVLFTTGGSLSLRQGLYVSKDVGTTWHDWSQGLPPDPIWSFPRVCIQDFTFADKYAFAVLTHDSTHLWRRPLSDLIAGIDEGNRSALPRQPQLCQNYPNPFNPSTTIRYGLPHKSAIHLTVFNTLGQQIALLQNGEQEAGYHEVRFDGSGLSSGVYFYRIEAGSFVQTRKLLLIR